MAKVSTRNFKQLLCNSEDNNKPYKFFIPTFQRGYRWTPRQVKELLEDLFNFACFTSKVNQTSKYYLQPIFVQKITDEKNTAFGYYTIVDGQQRITTLHLFNIMSENRKKMLALKIDNINYDIPQQLTFKSSTDKPNESNWIEKFQNALENNDFNNAVNSVDFDFLLKNYNYLLRPDPEKSDRFKIGGKDLYDILKEISGVYDRIVFIWYELDDSEDPIKVFTNINAGKISLTNSELIKANLLSFFKEKERDRIALEWEEIEKGLNENDFWHFINNTTNKITRIDFLFEIWEFKQGNKVLKKDYDLFQYFNDSVEGKDDATKAWEEIQDLYRVLRYWHSDYKLYHKIGLLLLLSKDRAKTIVNLYDKYSKIPRILSMMKY